MKSKCSKCLLQNAEYFHFYSNFSLLSFGGEDDLVLHFVRHRNCLPPSVGAENIRGKQSAVLSAADV